jgi:ribose/xylose/arabinose/galactoside ABC-type transport system permease subunit
MKQKKNIVTNFNLHDFLFTYGFLFVIVAVIVYFAIAANNFFSITTIFSVLLNAAPLFVIASGLAFVIMTANIDISVGSIAFLSSAIGALLISRMHISIWLALVIIVLMGALMGVLNGFIVVRLKVNPMIATLGTQLAFRGIGLQLTNSMVVSLPDSLRQIGNIKFGPIYLSVVISLLVLVIVWAIHTRTSFGRQVMAIGNGVGVAEKLGVKVKWVTFGAFVFSGLMAGLGGILMTLQIGAVTPTSGTGYEFNAIAMLVIGGVSLFGGEGSILPGIFIGGITLAVIETGLNYVGASVYVYPFVRGGVIFLSMFADALKTRVKPRVKMMADDEIVFSTVHPIEG